MKKTLIALAALAAIGSASAQTTITPYARLDIGLGKTTVTGTNDPGLTVASSLYNSSYFGVKTEADIGGGLKGYANLEEGFDSQAANQGFTNSTRNRGANIGIGGSFGRFDIGNVWGPYDNTAQDPTNYNGFSSYSYVLNAGAHGDNGNGNNAGTTVGSIQYTTPTVSGFTATINYAPRKDATATNDLSTTAFDVTYVAGPLNIAAAYERVPTLYTNDAGVSTGLNSQFANAYHISALYDLKTVVLGLAIVGAKVNGVISDGAGGTTGSDSDTGYNLAASFPMGQWTPSLGYGSVKTSGDNLNQTTSSFGVQALYSFTKVLTGYVGYRTAKQTFVSGAPDITTNKYAAGLSASF